MYCQVEAKCTIEQPTSVSSMDTVFSLAATRIIVPPMSSVTVQVGIKITHVLYTTSEKSLGPYIKLLKKLLRF